MKFRSITDDMTQSQIDEAVENELNIMKKYMVYQKTEGINKLEYTETSYLKKICILYKFDS